MDALPAVVVETPQFIRQAERLLSDNERFQMITLLAQNPKAGVVMPGTGGVRKMRWALPGRGKSGRARVIYYHYDDSIPIFLLSIFPKNVKVNLTQEEKNEMKRLVPALVQGYQQRREQ